MAGQRKNSSARARLQRILGPENLKRLQRTEHLDIASRQIAGRTYRLDSVGLISYWDGGEIPEKPGHLPWLCIQIDGARGSEEVVLKYLLITADEDRLLATANAYLGRDGEGARQAERYRAEARQRLASKGLPLPPANSLPDRPRPGGRISIRGLR